MGAATSRSPRVKNEGPAPADGIEIKIGENKRPFTDPYYAHTRRGAMIGWRYPGAWTIVFRNRTPLANSQFMVYGHGNAPRVQIDLKAAGRYPYSLMVEAYDEPGSTLRIYVDIACPEIIIDAADEGG
ncbi:MAG: hypothetical protein ACE15B_20065 [Bryobacteraceae bacterium]